MFRVAFERLRSIFATPTHQTSFDFESDLFWARRSLVILISVCTLVFGSKFVSAVSYREVNFQESPITAASQVFRDAGFDPVVAFAEDFWYQYIAPARIGGNPAEDAQFDVVPSVMPEATEAPKVANIAAWGPAKKANQPPARLESPVKAKKNEGIFFATKIESGGEPAVWVARVRPDQTHTSIYATVVWLDTALLAFQQVPGTEIPEGKFDRGSGQVAKPYLPFYVAGFANGYRMNQSQGGYVHNGQVVKKLKKGKATLLTYPDGSIDIVRWGYDQVKPRWVTARQNLDLMVQDGVSKVKNESAKWGTPWEGTGSGKNFVWRSGIGIRADGTIIYVQSDALSAKSLADLLVKAGVRKGMALDMNSGFAVGAFYGPYGKAGKSINNTLVPSDIFYKSSSRDFVAVFAKSPNP